MHNQTIPQLIKTLRERRRLAAYQLAKKAGISPSYLSLIENGQKMPSVEVAERLARVLGADPEVFRAWVETADEPDLDARQTRLEKLRRVTTSPEFRRVESSPAATRLHRRGLWRARLEKLTKRLDDESPEPAGIAEMDDEEQLALSDVEALSQPMRSLETSFDEAAMDYMPVGLEQTVHVPLLKEGTDPGRLRGTKRMPPHETVAVDRRLLEDDQDPQELFAYRVTSRSTERIHHLVLPGDILIFATDPEGVDPTAIYAVRAYRSILLSRIVYSEPVLLLTPADHNQSPMQVDVGNEDGLRRALAGVVVTGIRTWPKPKKVDAPQRSTSLGRSVRLEEGSLVRDCEWKENYGWRPQQRPEDMDYLDSHPGATVKYRLIRRGRVKYVLEMDAHQWREALGDYYDGPSWQRNGYIVAITKRVRGEYTEEFQERWADYVRAPERGER